MSEPSPQGIRWALLWPVLATLVVPLVVAWFVYPDTHLPPGFGAFPPEFVVQMPTFWWPYFLAVAAVVLHHHRDHVAERYRLAAERALTAVPVRGARREPRPASARPPPQPDPRCPRARTPARA